MKRRISLLVFVFSFLCSSFLMQGQDKPTPYGFEAGSVSEAPGGLVTQTEFRDFSNGLLFEMQRLLEKVELTNKQSMELFKREYDEMYNNISSALEVSDLISEVYESIDADITQALIYNKLAELNSPTSEALGFKFTDIILQQAVAIFDVPEQPQKQKGKFLKVVEKITGNPIVSAVSKEIPFVGLVRSVVTAASALFTKPDVSVEIKKTGKKVDVKTINPEELEFESKEIQAFVDQMQPYISFYEKLQQSNITFEIKVLDLQSRYNNLPELIEEYEHNLHTELGIIKGLPFVQKMNTLNSQFEYTNHSQDDFDFFKIIMKKNLINANNTAKQLVSIVFQLECFYAEYAKIVADNFSTNIDLLENEARQLPEAKAEKIDHLISFLKSNVDKVIENKFERNIKNIQSLRTEVTF